MIRPSALALLAVLAAVLPSCMTTSGAPLLHSHPAADADAAYWTEVEALAGQRGDTTDTWLLPFWFRREASTVEPGGKSVKTVEETHLNLGFATVPILPLWYGFDRGRTTPVGSEVLTSVAWSPLWASSTNAPDAEEQVDVFGVPLLYGGLDYTTPDERASVRQFLWSLGPMYADFEGAWDGGVDGWAFTPFFAGGLGPFAWISTEVQSDTLDMGLHGPLGLVWIDIAERTRPLMYDDDSVTALADTVPASSRAPLTGTRVRLAVGGFLWTGYEEFDENGWLVDARYGPLWTAFGWGRDDGDSFFTFLWIPVPF